MYALLRRFWCTKTRIADPADNTLVAKACNNTVYSSLLKVQTACNVGIAADETSLKGKDERGNEPLRVGEVVALHQFAGNPKTFHGCGSSRR